MKHFTSFRQDILKEAKPFKSIEDFEPLITQVKDSKIVMIGEASHGTKEFYEWRQLITQELILRYGFDFVSVEGDWPACQKVNNYVIGKHQADAYQILTQFSRWPTWMWANVEVLWFIEWLKNFNRQNHTAKGFHGLDVYSFYESIEQVISLLRQIDPELSLLAQKKYGCLDPYRHDEISYARSLRNIPRGCKQEILDVLSSTLNSQNKSEQIDRWFDIRQNAQIVANAEAYYRAMIFGEQDSWNVRDFHMMSTLKSLLDHYGPDSKGIVWAHNTHIGDYRGTDMVMSGQINIGGLARQMYGEKKVSLIGFGTYTGTVTASHSWDGPTLTLDVPEAMSDSLEDNLHRLIPEVGSDNFYFTLDKMTKRHSYEQVHGHRAIGVVYHPEREHMGNFVPTSLIKRYDSFIFLDKTNALTPLKIGYDIHKMPETYPFGNKI